MINIKYILSVACLILLCGAVKAQQNTAELSGTVTDSAGAVLVNARVAVRLPLTGFTRETYTNNVGLFTFTQLPLGVYLVTVSQAGFQTEIRKASN
jgi:hypothetical protein